MSKLRPPDQYAFDVSVMVPPVRSSRYSADVGRSSGAGTSAGAVAWKVPLGSPAAKLARQT